MSAFRNNNLATWAATRKRAAKAQSDAASELKLAQAHALAKRYEAAHLAATGDTVEVRYTHGWFRFKGAMYRRSDLARMADVLEARAAALINPDEESS